MDSANAVDCAALFAKNRFSAVVRLVAQTGLPYYSLENPAACINSHLVALDHGLEGCRQQRTPHLIHAGSSSVYGANRSCPSPRRTPVSLYGATKKANELMAHTYATCLGAYLQ